MFLSQVASALHYLHINHIVHGDLRAEYVNVLASDKVRSVQILARARASEYADCQFLLVSLFSCYNAPFPSCCYSCFETSLSYENEFFFSARSFSCRPNSSPCGSLCSRTRFENSRKWPIEFIAQRVLKLNNSTHTERFVSEQICF